MMFNVEVRYRKKPIKEDSKTGKMFEYRANYKIEELAENHINAMRKELTKIFKKYKSVFSIRFYV